MTAAANRDPSELARFDRDELEWWDPAGPMRALHALNPVRFGYLRQRCALPGRAALDVGCGGGLLAESLARTGARTTGIDLAAAALAQARAHARAQALELEYLELDAHALAQRRPGAFDVVACMELLEHVPDFPALLADCARLLRPGGDLFVSTLSRTPAAFALAIVGAEYLAGVLPAGTHRYDRFIRPSELARAARGLGLELADLRGLAYNPLSRRARLGGRPRINYLAHLKKPGAPAPTAAD